MSMVFLGITHCKKCWAKLDGEIGLCESCRQAEERESKSSEQVSKSEGKYKLIDILNKIANGELKEGTRIKHCKNIYVWKKVSGIKNFCRETEEDIFLDALQCLEDEVELIEPDHFADVGKMAEPTECNHIWREGTSNFGIVPIRFRKCKKCGCTETTTDYLREDTKMIEPTDNTKIEELDIRNVDNDTIWDVAEKIQHKLNEVIRYINK